MEYRPPAGLMAWTLLGASIGIDHATTPAMHEPCLQPRFRTAPSECESFHFAPSKRTHRRSGAPHPDRDAPAVDRDSTIFFCRLDY